MNAFIISLWTIYKQIDGLQLHVITYGTLNTIRFQCWCVRVNQNHEWNCTLKKKTMAEIKPILWKHFKSIEQFYAAAEWAANRHWTCAITMKPSNNLNNWCQLIQIESFCYLARSHCLFFRPKCNGISPTMGWN